MTELVSTVFLTFPPPFPESPQTYRSVKIDEMEITVEREGCDGGVAFFHHAEVTLHSFAGVPEEEIQSTLLPQLLQV